MPDQNPHPWLSKLSGKFLVFEGPDGSGKSTQFRRFMRAAEGAGLTTVRQPIRDKGRLLGRMLLDPSYTEERVVLPTELVVRSSTGPVPSR